MPIANFQFPIAVVAGVLVLTMYATAIADEVISRAWTIQNVFEPTFTEAISRADTIQNVIEPSFTEAISRADTIQNVFEPTFTEAISQAVTGCNISGFADEDGDGVHDCLDVCPGGDDNLDADADGVPDKCDSCPNDPSPVFVLQPMDTASCAGDPTMLSASATGGTGGAVSYQWRKGNQEVFDETESTLVFADPVAEDSGTYRVAATNACGTRVSNPAVLTVAPCEDNCAQIVCTASDQCHDVGTCDPATGVCSNPNKANGAACDDGNACTQSDTCQGGSCVGGNDIVCTASDQCHDVGKCNPDTGVCSNPNKANGAACSDGNACTTNDTCFGGVCVAGAAPNCNDGNVCTDDSCNPSSGCVHLSNTSPCSDGSACTTNDTCSGANCVGGPPPDCDDGNVCTDDSCNPANGCVHVNNTAPCNDGNPCTRTDTCQAGVCSGSNPVVCTALDQCHDVGTCNTGTGVCSNPIKANGTACDDGDACTTDDTCSGGVCVGGAALHCDDGNVCTDDRCDPGLNRCVFEDNGTCGGQAATCRSPGFWGTHARQDPSKRSSRNITQAVIDAGGGSLNVCGECINATVPIDDAASAVEALCVSPRGVSLLQNTRQLTALALNCIVSGFGADCGGDAGLSGLFDDCNNACVGAASTRTNAKCRNEIDCFNNGGQFNSITGFCQTGTCANGAACNGSTPCADLSPCIAPPDNCHDRPLVNEELGLDFDPPGPAGSSDECNAAHGNKCAVLPLPGCNLKNGAGEACCGLDSCP